MLKAISCKYLRHPQIYTPVSHWHSPITARHLFLRPVRQKNTVYMHPLFSALLHALPKCYIADLV